MIQGVTVHPLTQIRDDRGAVFHMLRCNDPYYSGFGEIYFSLVKPNKIKAWHLHSKMTLRYAVVCGLIRLVLYDDRISSSTRGEIMEIETGPDRAYSLIIVPPGVWNGFQGVSGQTSVVANCADIPHDPTEITRIDPHHRNIPYCWK